MIRIPYNSYFSLRLVFVDADDFPVDVSDADIMVNLSTRPTAPAYHAFLKDDSALNASRLDDGSIVVAVKRNALFPGKVKALVNVYAANDKRDHPQPHEEMFALAPVVPAEIIEGNLLHSDSLHPHSHHHADNRFNPDKPITVLCRFNLKNPQLSRHVTRGELNKAVESAMKNFEGSELASQDDIANILDKFSLPSQY